MSSCTCGSPESVDVSAWFSTSAYQCQDAVTSNRGSDDLSRTPRSACTFARNDDDAAVMNRRKTSVPSNQSELLKHRLFSNLSTFGWSPVSIHASSLLDESVSTTCGDVDRWKQRILELFRDDAISGLESDADDPAEGVAPTSSARSFRGGALTYRTSESGSPEIVEPKSSWEYKPPSATATLNSQLEKQAHDEHLELVESRLESWSRLCNEVAFAVCRMLELPPILLSPSAAPHESGGQPKYSSVDLLRAFCYDVVSDPCESKQVGMSTTTMGSSPHTDWGSFTVVWQDRVGGLQTFCRACQAWVDVPSSPRASEFSAEVRDEQPDGRVEFVVHVGDMTSLAIRQARLLSSSSPASKSKGPEKHDSAYNGSEPIMVPFPSPLHRVLSPRAEKRVSLVYFAYPCPEASLDDLVHTLLEWKLLPVAPTQRLDIGVQDREVPFEEYCLLRDQHQSQHSDSFRQSGADRFRELVRVPVRVALEEKWNQVQRP
jgi:2OG-Fe(II) oxygenase superfamily